jgi:hypothetical protein
MGTNQKYSLRWNDFSLNVASTFRDLHSRQVGQAATSLQIGKTGWHLTPDR